VYAQTSVVPPFITYQGRVSNKSVLIGANSAVNRYMIFRIWSHPTSRAFPDLVYSEAQVVTISQGEFNVLIGQGSAVSSSTLGFSEVAKGPPTLTLGAASVFAGAQRFLGITIDDGDNDLTADPEISPRQQLTSSSSAFLAKVAERIVSSGASQITIEDNGNVALGSGTAASAPLTFAGGAGDKISLDRAANGQSMGIGVLAGDSSSVSKLLQFKTSLPSEDITFGSGLAAAGEKMRLKGDGNVGIGTSSPGVKLDVAGAVRARDTGSNKAPSFQDGGAASGFLFGANLTSPTGLFSVDAKARGIQGLMLRVGNEVPMYFEFGGLMLTNAYTQGAFMREAKLNGVDTPTARLEVASMVNGYLYQIAPTDSLGRSPYNIVFGGSAPTSIYANSYYSIRAAGSVATSRAFITDSDRRIKRDIQSSVAAHDLVALQQLRVVDYHKVDAPSGRDVGLKGFIAQEVEAVLPHAVRPMVEFVPDIMSLATAVGHDRAAKTLTLGLDTDHGLKTGDHVRLHLDGKRLDLRVSTVLSNREFVAAGCEWAPEKVFVYGKQVSDFRTLNHGYLFTVAISALQELTREKDAAFESLTRENAALLARVTDLEEAEQALEVKLAALERQMRPHESVYARPATFQPTGLKQ